MASDKTVAVLNVLIGAQTKQFEVAMNRSEQRMRKMQQTVTRIGGMLGGFVAMDAMRRGIQVIGDFEFQMDKVAAISGATAYEVEQLSINAKELGANSKFTAAEIGKLQEELAKLGFATDQIINMTDASRKLATVADAELGESAKTVGQVLNAFALEATESNRIANIMAESFSKSALDLEKFGVAMGNVAANAKAFGLTVAQTTAYIGALVDSGIDASKAGTDLRRILIDTNKAGLTLNEAFDKIRNSQDKLGTATDMFGDRAAAAAIILADNEAKVSKLGDALSDTTMEMNNMVDIMEGNLNTDLVKLQSQFEGLVLQGDKFTSSMRDMVAMASGLLTITDKIINPMRTLGEVLGLNDEQIKQLSMSSQELKVYHEELKALAATLNANQGMGPQQEDFLAGLKLNIEAEIAYRKKAAAAAEEEARRKIEALKQTALAQEMAQIGATSDAIAALQKSRMDKFTGKDPLEGVLNQDQIDGMINAFGGFELSAEASMKNVSASLAQFQKEYSAASDTVMNQSLGMQTAVSQFAFQVGMSLGENINNFEDFIKQTAAFAKQFISQQMAMAISAAVAKELASKGIFGIATGALVGGLAAGLFNAALSAIPGFANGGIVTKPTLAMVGENGAEEIRPLRGRSPQGGNMMINGNFKISGRDLIAIIQKETQAQRKTLVG